MRLPDKRILFGCALGVLGTVVIGGLVASAVISSGVLDMSAVGEPDPLESTVGPWMLHASRQHRATDERNPFSDDVAAATAGLEHYRANCLPCHGAPEVKAAEFAAGFHPSAPHLTIPRIQALTDGELFWTVKNGVKMTGMPGFASNHTDEEVWHIVAAVRALGHLSAEQTAILSAPEAGHHHGEHNESSTGTDAKGSSGKSEHDHTGGTTSRSEDAHDHSAPHQGDAPKAEPTDREPTQKPDKGTTDATGIPTSPVPPFSDSTPTVPAR